MPRGRKPEAEPTLSTAVAELLVLQAEYAAWSEALPESLRNPPTAAALQEIIDPDLDTLADISRPERLVVTKSE